MKKVCKHYVKGNCNKGDNCDFEHIDNICQHHFFNKCKFGDSCKQLHTYKLKNKLQKLKSKNTETFLPSHKPADMRVMIGDSSKEKYNHKVESRDVVLVHNLFGDDNIYEKLLNEIKSSGINDKDLWKLWHGDTHLIADDHINWKSKCPTFSMVIDKIKNYFDIDIKATRLNLFRDSSDFKPFHHDAAAIDPKKAKTQNFTIGVSFGATRDAVFEHATTKTTVGFPLTNGTIYCFASDTNVEWRHGIPQLPPDKQHSEGRISIIAWGWIK